MSAAWGDEQAVLVDTVREFIDREVKGRNVQCANEYPQWWIELMKRTGVYAMGIPHEYGGQAMSMACYVEVIRELSRGWMSLADELRGHTIVARLLTLFGTEEQKRRYLPAMSTGELVATMALTEQGGDRQFQDGWASGSEILGCNPAKGFAQMMKAREMIRIHEAARELGVATAAMEDVLARAQQQASFGSPIWNRPAIGAYRAEMSAKLTVAGQLARYAAERYDSGARCEMEAATAEHFAHEVAMAVTLDVGRINGGYSAEFDINRGLIVVPVRTERRDQAAAS